MLMSLLLPIVVSAVVLFFASFLSWMVLKLHRNDWNGLPGAAEEEVMKSLSANLARPMSYMFPCAKTPADIKDPAFEEKMRRGPNGVLTIFGPVSMLRNLGLTFLYFLAVSFALGYLGSIALPAGAGMGTIFRFFFTAGLLSFLAAIVQHSIWFQNRIVGHVIESVAYAVIVGVIFGAMWPAA